MSTTTTTTAGGVTVATLKKLLDAGVARVYTPSDYEIIDIMESITDVIETSRR